MRTADPAAQPESSRAAPPAWSARDLATDPHAQPDKPERVQRMFAAIARSYDLNNRLHSLWRDQAWRRFAVAQARVEPEDVVLDVACGTGDLTEAFAHAGASTVVGLDFTPEMLEVARRRAARESARSYSGRITYIQGDAQELPFEDETADIVSIAFGLRNVFEPARAIGEFRRVLRPGGRLVILEFAEPTFPPMRWFNDLYCRRVMPVTATWISGDRSGAYRYLPKSVESFMTPEQVVRSLTCAGFASVRTTPLSLGICMCYRALVA